MLQLPGGRSIPFDTYVFDHGTADANTGAEVGFLRAASFPFCCGIRVTTDWSAVKNIRKTCDELLYQYNRDTPGLLLWTGVPKLKKSSELSYLPCADDQKTIDRLLENGWKIIQTFQSRMDGGYPVVLMCYNPHEEDYAE